MGIQIAAFNHLLNQHPAVRAELAAHAGRRIAVALPPLQVAGVLTDEGWLAACEGEPEATVRLKHAAALAAVAGRDPALNDVQFSGDAELAAAVGRLLGRLQWNAAEACRGWWATPPPSARKPWRAACSASRAKWPGGWPPTGGAPARGNAGAGQPPTGARLRRRSRRAARRRRPPGKTPGAAAGRAATRTDKGLTAHADFALLQDRFHLLPLRPGRLPGRSLQTRHRPQAVRPAAAAPRHQRAAAATGAAGAGKPGPHLRQIRPGAVHPPRSAAAGLRRRTGAAARPSAALRRPAGARGD